MLQILGAQSGWLRTTDTPGPQVVLPLLFCLSSYILPFPSGQALPDPPQSCLQFSGALPDCSEQGPHLIPGRPSVRMCCASTMHGDRAQCASPREHLSLSFPVSCLLGYPTHPV